MSTATSIDQTRARFDKSESETEKRLGFPATAAGRALINRYADELAGIIDDARTTRHGNAAAEIWKAVADRSDESLAINILAVALQANHEEWTGLWYSHIGTALGLRGAMAVKVGMWAGEGSAPKSVRAHQREGPRDRQGH
jgi:hypothetical protein